MNTALANILKSYTDTLPFADRTAGLVKAITFDNPGSDDSTLRKTIPVACNVTHADCKAGKYANLIPDSRVKSIMYWEDNGIRQGDYNGRDFSFSSSLRFVCWLNLKKLGKTDCNMSALAVLNVLNALPSGPFNSSPYTRIVVRQEGEVVKDSGIFSKYTYEENKMQYLMYPYDFFALDFNITFAVPRACIAAWTNGTEGCE